MTIDPHNHVMFLGVKMTLAQFQEMDERCFGGPHGQQEPDLDSTILASMVEAGVPFQALADAVGKGLVGGLEADKDVTTWTCTDGSVVEVDTATGKAANKGRPPY